MRKNRMLMSLIFALGCTAVACGGSDDKGVDDTTESLKRGHLGDAGKGSDRSDDSDEASEEASERDGGKRHDEHADAGDHRGVDQGEHDADCDRGGNDDRGGKDDDRGGKNEPGKDDKPGQGGKDDGKPHEDGGFHFGFGGELDGGFPHP